MANNSSIWQDDYWVLVLQLYQLKPVGVKRMYSRQTVALCMELHLTPDFVCERMMELRNMATPFLKRLVERYADNPRRLARDASRVRGMAGFAHGDEFYQGVEVNETWEKDFRELPGCGGLTIVALILVLDLYFRLTPITMVASTPEVRELARLLGVKADAVSDVMAVFQILDPYLDRNEFMVTPLLKPCNEVWLRYGNGSIERLAATAAQLKDYYCE